MTTEEKFDIIKIDLERAASVSGRSGSDIVILAVTKKVSPDRILPVLDMGITDIGENYVQELLGKYDAIKDKVKNVHFIGHLQTNKVKYIIDKVTLIHSVDRPSLLLEINKRAGEINKIQDILIEVNLTGETSKSGVYPENLDDLISEAVKLENISLKGFMTMPPAYYGETEAAEVYKALCDISRKYENNGRHSMKCLSMGMSGDYQVAIESGSSIIRLGRAIFGDRN